MSEWYDAAPPDMGEVVKKEFGTLIEDDPEWKVVGTIAKEDVISSWADDMPIKLQQSKSVTIPFDSIPMSGYTISGLAEMQEKWASNKATLAKYLGFDSSDSPGWNTIVGPGSWEIPAEYQFPKPTAPWVIFDEAKDLYATYSNGGIINERVAKQHECPHCFRPRHSEALRERVARMLSQHKFDPSYDASEDVSPIVCVGSETYGPNRGPTDVVRREVSYGYAIKPEEVSTKWAAMGASWTEMSKSWLSVLNDENLTITYKAITGNEEQE